MNSVTLAPGVVDFDPFRDAIEAWDLEVDASRRSRPAVLPHELALDQPLPSDAAGEPCCDQEWLERESIRYEGMTHDAGKAAARVIGDLVAEMIFLGVHSVADLDLARQAYPAPSGTTLAELLSDIAA